MGDKGEEGQIFTKSFIDKVIAVIGFIKQKLIFKDLEEWVICSVLTYTPQDVAVMDPAICVRYVINDQVYERLLVLVVVGSQVERNFLIW